MYPWGQDVKRHGEDQIDHQHEYPEEPRRSSAAGDQGRGHRGDQQGADTFLLAGDLLNRVGALAKELG